MNNIEAQEIESVRYVKTSAVPEWLQIKGDFWAVVFSETDSDVVISNSGAVLNIDNATGEVTLVK